MSKEKVLASSIISALGGKENIAHFTHCMTRLRVDVVSGNKVELDVLKKIDGVMGVVEDDNLQIVVGPGTVNKVAKEVENQTGIKMGERVNETNASDIAKDTKDKVEQKTKSPMKQFLRRIGNIFFPLIPGLVASGLINGLANLAKNSGVNPAEALWLQLLLLIGGGLFGYLTILVGYNTAKEFGGTPVLGAIAGILIINPGLAEIKLFDEALVPGRGGIFAVLFAAWLMTFVEKQVRKVVPTAVDIILTPTITVLIVGFATLYTIQPVGGWLADGITTGLTNVVEMGGAFAGFILAGTFLPLVMFGLHHGLTPIHLQLIQETGTTMLLPILAMAGAGQVGAAIAIYVKTKNTRLRNTIKGALPVGFLGIGEPLLYGVTLPLGRPFLTACLGAAFGGALQAVFKTAAVSIGVSGLTLTPLIDGKVIYYLIGIFTAYVFGFIFTYLFGFKEEMAKDM